MTNYDMYIRIRIRLRTLHTQSTNSGH